jgi:DNA-binding response OmpR family regulator
VIRVLIIDPENQAAVSVAEALEGQKMRPTIVSEVDEGLRQLEQIPPHVVVLAAHPGDQNTEDLCRAVCERTLAPLLVVGRQAHDDAVERILAAGADAHVLEPCSKGVLIAQLWALLRRVGLVSESSVE